MTKDKFEREKNYQVSRAIAKTMLSKGLITTKDYKKIDTMLIAKYNPVIGSFR